MMWIDSHCHLNHKRFFNKKTVEEIVTEANNEDVRGMLSINCQIATEFDELLQTVSPFRNVWCSIGTHPHDAALKEEQDISVEDICKHVRTSDKVIGIGESGLDYFYENSPKEEQQKSFRKHIRACLETDIPLIIHTRDADEDTIRILREEAGENNEKGLRGVFHCFSSGAELAKQGLDFGFYLSFSGILTFKKSEKLREIAKSAPLERILVETDAPYLTPEPHRKEINMPSYVPHTGGLLADLHNLTHAEMAERTTENFFTLFSKAKATWQA